MINKPRKEPKKRLSKTKQVIAAWTLFGALIASDPSFAQTPKNDNNKVTTTVNIQKDTNEFKRMTNRLDINANKQGIPGKETFVKMLQDYAKTKTEEDFVAMMMIIEYINKDAWLTPEQKFAYAVFFAGSGEYTNRLMKKIDQNKMMEYMNQEAKFSTEAMSKKIEELKKKYEEVMRINKMLKDLLGKK